MMGRRCAVSQWAKGGSREYSTRTAAALLTVAASHKLAADEDLRHSAHASDALQSALYRTALGACNAPCNLAQHQWLAMIATVGHVHSCIGSW